MQCRQEEEPKVRLGGCEGDNVLERTKATEWLRMERQKSRKGLKNKVWRQKKGERLKQGADKEATTGNHSRKRLDLGRREGWS